MECFGIAQRVRVGAPRYQAREPVAQSRRCGYSGPISPRLLSAAPPAQSDTHRRRPRLFGLSGRSGAAWPEAIRFGGSTRPGRVIVGDFGLSEVVLANDLLSGKVGPQPSGSSGYSSTHRCSEVLRVSLPGSGALQCAVGFRTFAAQHPHLPLRPTLHCTTGPGADVACSRRRSDAQSNASDGRACLAGTLAYMAPEMHLEPRCRKASARNLNSGDSSPPPLRRTATPAGQRRRMRRGGSECDREK